MIDAVTEFGFSEIPLSTDDFLKPNIVVKLGYPPNRIDLLTSISGVVFEEAWNTKVGGELDGLPVHFIGRELLLKNKRESGREKDIADLNELLTIRGAMKKR